MLKTKKKYTIISILAIKAIFIMFIFKSNADNSNIKIGLLAPLSGSASQYGMSTKQGMCMCIDEINASGGINGKKLVCVEYDDEGDPSKTLAGYGYLKDEGVSAIVTGILSDEALIISDQAKDDNVPIIITTASADEVTINSENNKTLENVFRVGFTNSFQGEKTAELAKSKGVKNAAILFCRESEYSSGLKDAFSKRCEQLGINISTSETFPMKSVEFQRQLENIKDKNPDLIFIPHYRDTVSLILSQAESLGIKCLKVGPDGWRGINGFVSDTSCLENCFYCDLFAPDDPNGDSKTFSEKKEKRFDIVPDLCSACGYNAVLVLEDSIKRLDENSKTNSDKFREKILSNLVSTNINGIGGNISFDKLHNPKKKAVIVRIKDGNEEFYQRI